MDWSHLPSPNGYIFTGTRDRRSPRAREEQGVGVETLTQIQETPHPPKWQYLQ